MNAAEAVERAAATGRWMVAAWRIDDAGAMHLDRVWVNFPAERCGEAIELLRSDVAKVGGFPLADIPPSLGMQSYRRYLQDRERKILDVSVDPPKLNDEGGDAGV